MEASEPAANGKATTFASRCRVALRGALPPWPPVRLGVALLALLLLCVHALVIVNDSRVTEATTDEANYFNCGHIILEHGWSHEATVFQGPVPLYANQLFVRDFPAGGYRARVTPHEILEEGRLGTLPFALLSALLVFVWARMLFGDVGGLFALLLHALNPLLIGFGALILVDSQHAAMTLLTLFATWCWTRTRSPLWLPCIGIALGLTLATKYLALFLVPVIAVTLVLGSLGKARAGLVRLRSAALRVGTVGATALLAMHAAYRFLEPFGSFELGWRDSELMKKVMAVPLLGQAVTALPAPFLRGLNFQLFQGQRLWKTYLNGVTAPSHPDFYVWSILCKTPEIVLISAALVAVLRLPRLLRRDADPAWRSAAGITLAYCLIAVGYLSLFTKMQLGIRYIIPVYPLLLLWQGALLHRVRRVGAAIVALFLVTAGAHALDLRRNWPDLIAYYNASSGGQELAYRRFRNTNSDFGQYGNTGPALLRARYPGVQILSGESGPRFGRVGIDCGALRTAIMRWITVDPSLYHLGASWWVFDVSAGSLEEAVAASGDNELRRDLCIAYLGEGRRLDAQRHIPLLGADEARPLVALMAAQDAVEVAPTREHLEALIDAWAELGRPDLGEALYQAHTDVLRVSRAAAAARVLACQERNDYEGAIAVFGEFEFGPRDHIRLTLVADLRAVGRHDEGRRAFEELRRNLSERMAHTPGMEELAEELELHRRYLELLR